MLYKLAHIIRDHAAFLWNWAEAVNSFAFGCRYAKGLKRVPEVLALHSVDNYRLRVATVEDAGALEAFFVRQPEKDFEFFRPHGFDRKSLLSLISRTSFMMFVVDATDGGDNSEIVGYFFLRSFVHGQTYLGKMVDHEHQGQGIGKMMCKAAMDVALTLGIRMFESINKNNMASMRSTGAVLKQVVLAELGHGDLLIEDLPLSKATNIKS